MTVWEATAPTVRLSSTIFMILFGVNFSAYYLLLTKKFVQAFKFEEVRYYFGIILAAILVIGLNTAHLFRNLGEAFQQAAFQVGSIITTTGFSSTDFSQWPSLSTNDSRTSDVCRCMRRKYRWRNQSFPNFDSM